MENVALQPALTCAEEPLSRAQGGDNAAFAELVEANQAMVFSIAYHALANRAVAEDLAQDVFTSLYRHLHSVKSNTHLIRWLRRTTSHRVIDFLRRKQRTPPCVELRDDSAQEGVVPSDPWRDRRLRQLVSELPVAQRLAVVLRYQEDLLPREIAETLEVPLNTVKSQLRRGLAALRTALEGPAPEEVK